MTCIRCFGPLGLRTGLLLLLSFCFSVPALAAIQGEYFVWTGASPPADPWNVENRKGTRIDANVDFNWTNPGIGGIGEDLFSVRWRGQVYIPTAGDWTFYTATDDGARLYVNAELIINQWVDQAKTEVGATRSLGVGWHDIIMEYYENAGGAEAQLSYAGPGVGKQIIPAGALRAEYGKGLLAEYHHGRWDGAHTLVISRNDGTVNFNWNTGTPQPEVSPDNFCARWRGKVEVPTTGNYTFYVTSDDGQALWLNGTLAFNNVATPQGPTPLSTTVALTGGQKYFIEVQFNEFTGGAACWMEWEGPGSARQIVPERYLHAILNEAPGNIALSNATIGSNLPANTVVGAMSTTDIDNSTGANPAQTHTYALVSGTGDTHNSLFNLSGANLRATNANMAVGTYSVRVRTTDNGQIPNNLTYEKAFTITVTDTTPPTAICKNFTAQLGGTGQVAVVAADIDGGSTDNVGITLRQIDGAASKTFSCANLGPNTVTLRVQDGAGNFATCTATVTVADSINPVITVCAPGQSASANVSCQAAVPDFTGGVTASDNCAVTGITQNPPAGTLVGLGDHSISLTVNDAAGNSASCQTTFTVTDTTDPVITTCASNQTVSADASCQALMPDFTGGVVASDNCAVTGITQNPPAGTPVGLGDHSISLTVNDAAGNTASCQATLTVQDTSDPVITTCASNQTASADISCQASVPDFTGGVVASDNCAVTGITQNPSAGTVVGLGAHTITLTVSDGAGNTATCPATFTVEDTTAPVAVCKDITVNLSAPTIAALAIDNGSSDNCAIASMLIDGAVEKTFTCADMPSVSVTLTVADAAGNSDTCTATVTVVDDISPSALCQDITVNLSTPTILAAALDGGSSDNCAITSQLIDGAADKTFTCANVGANTVTLRVEDAAGNYDECTATVTVVDDINPVAVCQNITVNLSAPTITASAIDGGSTDNCGITSRLINGAASRTFTCAHLGDQLVTLRVTDAAGNFNECTATVTVVDDIPPVAGCRTSLTVNLSSPTIAANALNLGSSDTCGTVSYQIDGAASKTFTCADLGANTVTLTVLDGAGNTATCASTVTVVDNIAPIAACKDATVYLSSPTLVPGDIDNGSSDNCAITSMLVNGVASITYGLGDVGVQSVTLRVVDGAGLFAECTAQVTIVDDTPIEGEGEAPVEGEGEAPVEGEGEPPIEGEGEAPVEGEGEPPVEGEGEPQGLTVTADPTEFTVAEGASVTFEVQVSGAQGTPSFQWNRYTPDKMLTPIPDATDSTYTLSDITFDDAGQYQCEVYDGVLEETVLSPIFTLAVGSGVPVVGLLGLALVSALTALAGTSVLRKKK